MNHSRARTRQGRYGDIALYCIVLSMGRWLVMCFSITVYSKRRGMMRQIDGGNNRCASLAFLSDGVWWMESSRTNLGLGKNDPGKNYKGTYMAGALSISHSVLLMAHSLDLLTYPLCLRLQISTGAPIIHPQHRICSSMRHILPR